MTETLYQTLFSILVSVSDRFPSLNPLSLRRVQMGEFCIFARDLLSYQKRSKRAERNRDRRPAGDSWF